MKMDRILRLVLCVMVLAGPAACSDDGFADAVPFARDGLLKVLTGEVF
jgi:hypothetical protein